MNEHVHDDDGARLAEAGGQLLLRLTALLRTARTYDISNQAFQRQMQEFVAYRATFGQSDRSLELEGQNHFTILRELESETGQLTQLLLTAFGKSRSE